jgi:DNA-binding response OmpR family regulator
VSARVVVLAQDLIWADRLARAVEAAGAEPVRVATLQRFEEAIADIDAAIVDLTALAYDGVAAIQAATTAGARVLAVGQHDDHELRKRALAAGADHVYAYRKLFEDGPATIAAWLGGPVEIGS